MVSNKMKKLLIRPFTYIHDSIGIEATKISILLGIQVLMLIITASWTAIFNIIACVLGAIGAYFINQKINKYDIHDYFALLLCLVQGLITGMLIPSTFNPLTVFLITVVTMLVVKHLFGGFSYAWANPAIFTVIVLWIVGYRLFPDMDISSEILAMRNPSQYLIENGVFRIYKYDSGITDALNSSIFGLFKVSVPEGYISLLWDTGSCIPAFRFNLITLVSSLFLFCDNLVKVIIPAAFLIVYSLLIRFLGPVFFNGVSMQGDMILALFTSGTFFTAVYVLGWYGTTPSSIQGKLLYGIFAGISAFFICGGGTSPVGMAFTVLISNIFSIIIQQFENRYDRISLSKMLEENRKLQEDM